MKRRAILLLCGTWALGGCAPSLQSLVSAKHYREAICAGAEGNESDKNLVGQALDKDADLLVHMYVVSRDELQPVLGEKTEAATKRGRIVRVNVQSNVLPIDNLEISGSFVTTLGQTAAVTANWSSLAWITNEELPQQRVEKTYLTGENILKGGAAILTAGLSLLFTNFNQGSVVVDPPLSEYMRMAPHASALHRAAGHSGCSHIGVSDGTGQRCSWNFVLDNVSSAPVSFDINTRYVSMRQTSKTFPESEATCFVYRSVRLPLGSPQDIEKIVRERFGTQMVPVRTISTRL
jgi:hypothetical protein